MADHPFDTAAETIDANMTPGGVSETLLDAMKLRTALALGATESLGDFDFSEGSPPNAVVYGATGYVYFYNADDTTTPDDGSTCLVSMDGRRYILADMSAMAISAALAIDNDPPASPVDADAYVVGVSPTGDWVGHAKDIALYTPRGWVFAQPKIGTALLNIETAENIQYDASGTWVAMPTAIGVDSLAPEQEQFWGGLSVEAQQNAPPGSPTEGLYYLVGLTPSGNWVGHENDVAYYTSTSTWAFLAAYDGATLFNKSSDTTLTWFDATGEWKAPFPINWICQGRLTLESGVPISTTDQTAKATLYFTPFRGNSIALYVNGGWALRAFTEKSLSLAGYTTGKPFDIFGYDDAGVLAIESLVWTNDTTRATAIVYQDGIPVKSGDATRRLLGTIYTTATGQTEDSLAKRMVWNVNNRVRRPLYKIAADATWSYNSNTYRQANNNAANQVEVVVGLSEDEVEASASVLVTSGWGAVAVGVDAATVPAGTIVSSIVVSDGSTTGNAMGRWRGVLAPGRHRLMLIEYVFTSTAVFVGTTAPTQSGLQGSVFG